MYYQKYKYNSIILNKKYSSAFLKSCKSLGDAINIGVTKIENLRGILK